MNSSDGRDRLIRLFPALSDADARIAISLYRLLAGDDDVHAASIARVSGEPEAHVRYLLNEWPGVFRGTGGEIVGFWGLARPEMAYEVHIGGRHRYAWCAWDTLFIPEILDAEVRVEATTGVEQSPVRLVVSPSAVAEEVYGSSELFVSFNLPDDEGWEQNVVSSFCHHVHFLAAHEVEPWLDQNPGGFVLTLAEAFDAGRGKNLHQFGSAQFDFDKQQAAVGEC